MATTAGQPNDDVADAVKTTLQIYSGDSGFELTPEAIDLITTLARRAVGARPEDAAFTRQDAIGRIRHLLPRFLDDIRGPQRSMIIDAPDVEAYARLFLMRNCDCWPQ